MPKTSPVFAAWTRLSQVSRRARNGTSPTQARNHRATGATPGMGASGNARAVATPPRATQPREGDNIFGDVVRPMAQKSSSEIRKWTPSGTSATTHSLWRKLVTCRGSPASYQLAATGSVTRNLSNPFGEKTGTGELRSEGLEHLSGNGLEGVFPRLEQKDRPSVFRAQGLHALGFSCRMT